MVLNINKDRVPRKGNREKEYSRGSEKGRKRLPKRPNHLKGKLSEWS